MKHRQFKISDSTLFVYKSQKNLKNVTETESTDPTTSMVTLTKTGIFPVGRAK